MAVRFCPACGTARHEGDGFCRNCGRDLSRDDASDAISELDASGHPAPEPPPPPAPVAVIRAEPVALPMPESSGYVDVPGSDPSAARVTPPPMPAVPPAGAAPTAALPATPVPAEPRAGVVGFKGPVRPIALVGAAAVLVGVFLPWVSDTFGGGNGFDVPLSFLWSLQNAGGVKLGLPLLILAGVAAALTFVPGTGPIRRILGVAAMAAAVVYGIQLFRLIDQLGGSVGDVFDTLGAAVYVTLVGGGLLSASK